MLIQDPLEIELAAASRSLLAEVGEAQEQLELLRPFSPDVAFRLQTALLPG
jgi:hypothetical protein